MRIALGIEYDGRAFAGWQTQPHGNTVQDVLNLAISEIAQTPLKTVAAGRTDTGVHAMQQVVHFDCEVQRPPSAWIRGVNSRLPNSVSVLWVRPVSADFHARFSAFSRSYSYFLLVHPVRPALCAGKVGWFHRALDVEAMAGCTSYDVITILKKGRHDVRDCRVEVESERALQDPKVFTKIHLHFEVSGRGIRPEAVERAIQLSAEKYCSASIMLGKTAEISHDFTLSEAVS